MRLEEGGEREKETAGVGSKEGEEEYKREDKEKR